MAGGERDEGTIGIGIELDEDEVPNLDTLGATLVHQRTLGVSVLREIDMQLRAGTAWAGLTHHPEVVLLVPGNDVDGGIESLGSEKLRPEGMSLSVEGGRITFGRLIDRSVEPLRRKFPDIDEEFPSPGDRLFLKVIAEGPVPEHLEKGVVIGVEADILQIVVRAARADAFLGVGCPRGSVGAGSGAQEDRHELVHASIREEEIGRAGQQAGGRDNRVFLAAEKI